MLLLLGPFCPHVTEELWSRLGHAESLFKQRWPAADPAALQKTEVTVVVQVDGKVRGRLLVDVDSAADRIRQLALGDDRVRPWVERRRVEKVVVVPNRLVNIVTRAWRDPAARSRSASPRSPPRSRAAAIRFVEISPTTSRRWPYRS